MFFCVSVRPYENFDLRHCNIYGYQIWCQYMLLLFLLHVPSRPIQWGKSSSRRNFNAEKFIFGGQNNYKQPIDFLNLVAIGE